MLDRARRLAATLPLLALLALATALFGAQSLSAQELHGKFVEAASGEPVEGAQVRLLDGAGATAATDLTGPEGAARLAAPAAGSYRVVVERIGFESWTSEAFELGAGEVERRTFRISVRPIELGGLAVDVEDDRRCRVDPTTGRATASLWEEIRKALERERMTREAGRVSYRVREYRRVLDGRLRLVSEDASTLTTAARSPYRSVPAGELSEVGFVVRDTSGWIYRAPDADVLLSEPFQRTHCFGIAEDEEAGRVGLTFRPIEERTVPEIEGTLWVDAESAALEEVAFHYTNLDLPVPDSVARGRVAFERVPSGDWYVSRWWIRWPSRVEQGQLEEQGMDETGAWVAYRDQRVVQFGEVGAEVASLVATGGEEPEAEPERVVGRGSVAGTAWDSLAGRPAGGVTVRIRGTGRRTSADGEGRFVFRAVPEGRYRVSFAHPLLPGLPDSLTAATVEIEAGLTADVRLASPGPDRVRRWACGDRPGGVVLGRVLDEESGEPVAGARVWFGWGDAATPDPADAVDRAVADAGQGATAEADSAGRFVACGMALDRRVAVEARGGTDTLTFSPGRRVATLTLRSDPDAAVELADREATGGAGTELTGTVRARGTGEPLPGARLELIDADRTVTAETGGRFTASNLSAGSHRLVVEHLGYRTDTVQVALEAGTATFVELTAETDPVELGGLEVSVERQVRDRQLRGFYRRMERGVGRFASKEDVERWGVMSAVRRMPNTQIRPCYQGGAIKTRVPDCYRLTKATRGGALSLESSCSPRVYIDGTRVASDASVGGTLSAFNAVLSLPPDAIEGIEVHEAGSVPPEYGGVGSNCGVMLVWTSR